MWLSYGRKFAIATTKIHIMRSQIEYPIDKTLHRDETNADRDKNDHLNQQQKLCYVR